jgi:capsular exopolysaccharide synthesis family protein
MTDAAPAPTQPSPEERGARARQVAGVVARRGPIIAACAVLIPVLAYVLVAVQPREHRASAIVQPAPLIPSNVVVSSSIVPTGWFASPSASFVALLAKTPPVRIETARLLNRPAAQLGAVDATAQKKTGWVTIGVTARSAREAVDGANAFASATAQNLRLRTRRAVTVLIGNVQGQLATARDPVARGQIRAQLAALRAFRPADAQPIQVIAPAVAATPVSNNPGLAAALAFVFALYLGWRLARLAERADESIHEPDEVERVAEAPLLTAFHSKGATGPEPFLRLRDSIVHLTGQTGRATLVVTSPRNGEGRTSIAIGLAKAYTAAGRSVALVDGDFRDPQIATRVVVSPQPGLADVLAGASLSDTLHVGLHPRLSVLPAGDAAAAQADLLGSERMGFVLRELASRFEIVVVDTAPLLAASDALALVNQASGVVLVARIDQTSRRALRRAAQILRRAGANVLGSVATGLHADTVRLPAKLSRPVEQPMAVQAPGG